MATLEIVWRNPNKVQKHLRYLPQPNDDGRKLYTVQQSLSEVHDIWVNTSVLEVISPCPSPRSQQGFARLWHFEFGS